MALEQVFKCPRTCSKLRSGALGGLMDGFCDALLGNGFASGTVRKHLSNVGHLNAYLGTLDQREGQVLCAQTVAAFLTSYPAQARNRGPLDRHVALVKASVNHLADYLRTSGLFEAPAETAIYQPLLGAYLRWLEEHQHAAPGTIKLRGPFCWPIPALVGASGNAARVLRADARDGRAILFNLRQAHGACGATLDAGGLTHVLAVLFATRIHPATVAPGGADIALLQAGNSGARTE